MAGDPTRVLPVTDGDRSYVKWSSRFEIAPEHDAARRADESEFPRWASQSGRAIHKVTQEPIVFRQLLKVFVPRNLNHLKTFISN